MMRPNYENQFKNIIFKPYRQYSSMTINYQCYNVLEKIEYCTNVIMWYNCKRILLKGV